MKTKQKVCMVLFLIAIIALAVAGWLLLPEEVAMQIQFDGGRGNVVSKPLAVMLPVLAGLYGVWLMKKEVDGKSLILGALGIVVPIITILMNR